MISRIFDKKIIICSGSGGVGKTTTAAAIALEAARRGKKAIVLTIDPAKRLATAMGLESLGDKPKPVALPMTPQGARGKLFAMMLDTKRTFDRLIERYASDPTKREAIFKNRLYQNMSSMISGSQEYMAMEKLYELYESGAYDFLVLDTPPTRHALDFIEAPQKMIQLTGHSLLEWFLKPGLFATRLGLGVLQKGAEKILGVLDRLAGMSFLYELAEMISLLGDLLGGFHQRAKAVSELLHENYVGFLLVTTPASLAIQDALFFHKKIQEYKLPFAGFILNRFHNRISWKESDLTDALPSSLRSKISEQLKNYTLLAQHDERALTLLKKMSGKKTAVASVPLFEQDVHDLDGLQKINVALFA